MLVVFGLLSILSTFLLVCCAAALLNVVIRRANASLIEEQINGLIDSWSRFTPTLLEQIPCSVGASDQFVPQINPAAPWPQSNVSISVTPRGTSPAFQQHGLLSSAAWFGKGSFAGVVNDRGSLEIRAVRSIERQGCSVSVLVRVPFTESLLKLFSREAGLEISGTTTVLMQRYREQRGILGEIEANFLPGSGRVIPVLVSARNLETGNSEVWTVGQLRPTLTRTVWDLNRMGLRRASWISPFGGIAFGLFLVYTAGFVFSARLGGRIVSAIDGLSTAARQVGRGDFSAGVCRYKGGRTRLPTRWNASSAQRIDAMRVPVPLPQQRAGPPACCSLRVWFQESRPIPRRFMRNSPEGIRQSRAS
jgi:hypothetical protein